MYPTKGAAILNNGFLGSAEGKKDSQISVGFSGFLVSLCCADVFWILNLSENLAAIRFVRSLRIAFEGSHGAALLIKPVKVAILGFANRSLTLQKVQGLVQNRKEKKSGKPDSRADATLPVLFFLFLSLSLSLSLCFPPFTPVSHPFPS